MDQHRASFHTQTIRYLAGQDGPAERELKAIVSRELADHPRVERAYLVRVAYGAPAATSVALCIRGPEDMDLLGVLQSRFAALFGAREHLDIVFRPPAKEQDVRRVARPFYERAR